MAVAFDAASSAVTYSNVASASWSHTCTGSNLLLIVGTGGYRTIVGGPPAVTYNSVSMSVHDSVTGSSWDFAQNGISRIWKLVAPATGANTVAATFYNSEYGVAGSVSYTGVDQTTPLGTAVKDDSAGGTATSDTNTVSSASGNMVGSLIGVDYPTSGHTAGNTGRWQAQERGAGGGYFYGYEDAAGGASVNMSWSWTVSKHFAHIAVEISAAAGGGGGRTTKNTRAAPLGVDLGMDWRS